MISYCKYGFIFPSNLNNQLDFVVAKQDESEGEVFQNLVCFLSSICICFTISCGINLIK